MTNSTSYTCIVTRANRGDVTPATAGHLAELLAEHGAAVAFDDTAVEITFTVAGHPFDIPRIAHTKLEAAAISAGIDLGAFLACDILALDEHDRRLAEPAYPELVGVTEVAALLGITRQRASALQTRPGFPQPLQVLASGPVWPRTWIDRFASTWVRKAGRPAKQLPKTSIYTFDRLTDPQMATAREGKVIELSDGDRVRVIRVVPSGSMTTLHLEEVDEDVTSGS